MSKEIAAELEQLRARNARVEADKAWETSLLRKCLLCSITYVCASMLLFVIGAQFPLLGALVPTLGFYLSTLTLPIAKKLWLKNFYLKKA